MRLPHSNGTCGARGFVPVQPCRNTLRLRCALAWQMAKSSKVNRLMNRKPIKQWLSLTFLLTGALLRLPAQSVDLQYAPQDGAMFDVVETVTQVTTVSGADPVTDVRERKSLVTVAAVSASSQDTATTTPGMTVEAVPDSTAYSNQVTIVSQSLTRDGDVIVSPVHAALGGLELTYHLDADGKLLAIAGHDGLGDAMAASLPDKLANTLVKLVNSDTLLYQDTASYEEVYGPFTEGSITPVADSVSAASQALPHGGSVPLYTVSTIETDGDDKIRVSRAFNSDAAALAEQFDGLDEAAILATKGTLEQTLPETYESASVSGSETVLVQTSGALVESRTFSLTSEWTLEAAAGETAVTHQIAEVREFTATAVAVSDDSTTTPAP